MHNFTPTLEPKCLHLHLYPSNSPTAENLTTNPNEVTEKRVIPERPSESRGFRGERPVKDPNWGLWRDWLRLTLRRGLRCPHGEEDEDAETVHLSGVEGSADLRDAMLHLLLTLSTVPVAVANAIAIAIPKPYKTQSFALLLFPNLLSMSHGF